MIVRPPFLPSYPPTPAVDGELERIYICAIVCEKESERERESEGGVLGTIIHSANRSTAALSARQLSASVVIQARNSFIWPFDTRVTWISRYGRNTQIMQTTD